MGWPFHIALRYLFAKKSHHVINIISLISAAGIAIGSMALVLILSVYNGFENRIRETYADYEADFVVTPEQGKFMLAGDSLCRALRAEEGVAAVCPILQENVFVRYGSEQAIAQIRGVDESYLRHGAVTGKILEGEFATFKGQIPHVVVGQELAMNLDLRVRFLTPLWVYFPKRSAQISVMNPMESLHSRKFFPSGIVSLTTEMGNNVLYADLSVARELLECREGECTCLQLYALPEQDQQELGSRLRHLLPDSLVLKDRQQQNETLYRLMKAEKFAVYLILFFIILIISINIFSSLSMLIIDKEGDIGTYMSMGAETETVRRIFHLHGFFISLSGCLAGTVTGIVLALLQQHFEIVTIPGNYLASAYPVDIVWTDVLIVFAGVSAIGFLISWLPIRKIFRK